MIHSMNRSLKFDTVLITNVSTLESLDGKKKVEVFTPDLKAVNELRDIIFKLSNIYSDDNEFWLYLDTTLHFKNFSYEII